MQTERPSQQTRESFQKPRDSPAEGNERLPLLLLYSFFLSLMYCNYCIELSPIYRRLWGREYYVHFFPLSNTPPPTSFPLVGISPCVCVSLALWNEEELPCAALSLLLLLFCPLLAPILATGPPGVALLNLEN